MSAPVRAMTPLLASLAGACGHATPLDTASVTFRQLAVDLGVARRAALPERLDLCTEMEARDGTPRLYCPERILAGGWRGQRLGIVVEPVEATALRFTLQLDVDLR